MTEETMCETESTVIKGAIWHALNHYQFEDALFMSERLIAESQNQEEVFLLATCHYRMGNKWATKEILEKYGNESSQCRFLYTRVLVDLNEEGKALSELSGSCLTLTKDGEYSRDVSDFIYEFQDSTSFALILAAEIHQTNRQYDRAADCYKKALAHNPFLFTPFQKLCQIGKGQEPEQLFHIAQYPTFEMTKCVAPYKVFDEMKSLKIEVPVKKQSKQALQTVTNNTITEHATTPVARTVSSPSFGFRHTPTHESPLVTTAISPITPAIKPIEKRKTSKSMLVQNSTSEMRKHLSKYEKNQKRAGLRSGTGRTISRNLNRQTLTFDSPLSATAKENSLGKVKRLTRSSTIDPAPVNLTPNDKKIESEEDDPKSESSDEKLKSEKLKKKRIINDEAKPRKVLEELLNIYRQMAAGYWARSQHKFDEAKRSLDCLPQNHRETGWVLNQLARCLFDQQKYLPAIEIYQKIQIIEPYRLSGLEYYSTCLFYKKDITALSALSSQFLSKARDSPETWCIVGNLLSANQDHETAKKYFLRAVELTESSRQLSSDIRHYAYTLLGHELILEDDFDKAKDSFRKAIRISPNMVNARLGIAQVAMKEQNFNEANNIFKLILNNVPRSLIVLSNLGRSYFHIKQHDSAMKCFNRLLKKNPKDPISLFYAAKVKYELGNYEECLTELKKLNDFHPNDPQINFQLGKVYNKLGNYNLSFGHMTRATKLDPKGTAKQKDCSDSFSLTNDSSTLEGGNFDSTVGTSETSYARHQYETSYADAEEYFSNINY